MWQYIRAKFITVTKDRVTLQIILLSVTFHKVNVSLALHRHNLKGLMKMAYGCIVLSYMHYTCYSGAS